MNKQGEMNVGGIFMLAIALILGTVFIVQLADSQAVLTTTQNVVNQSVTGTNFTNLTLNGQRVSSVVVLNGSSGSVVVPATNYTLYQFVLTNGQARALLQPNATVGLYAGHTWLVTYTYEPVGYNTETSSRTVATLPLLFFALTLLGVAVLGIRDWLGNK